MCGLGGGVRAFLQGRGWQGWATPIVSGARLGRMCTSCHNLIVAPSCCYCVYKCGDVVTMVTSVVMLLLCVIVVTSVVMLLLWLQVW